MGGAKDISIYYSHIQLVAMSILVKVTGSRSTTKVV